MPVARVEINGRIARIEVPAGTTPEQAKQMAMQAIGQQPKDNSRTRGFLAGALKPLDNLTTWAMNSAPMQAIDRAGVALGLPSAAQATAGNNRARQNNSRTGYQLLGNIAGTLPTAYIPGGVLAQGAAGGALLSENPNDLRQVATDAAFGAVAGKAGQQVGRRIVAPLAERVGRTAPVRALARAGTNAVNQAASRVPPRLQPKRPVALLPNPRLSRSERAVGKMTPELQAVRQNVQDAADLNLPYALADAHPKLQALAGSVVRHSPDAKTMATQQFNARSMGQADRAVNAIDDYLAPITNIEQRAGEIRQAAQGASAPFYDAARAQPAMVDDELRAMLGTPAGQDALGRAHTIAANEGKQLGQIGDEAPFETLQMVKRGLDAKLSEFRNPITGKLDLEGNPEAQAIAGLTQRLNEKLGSVSDDYAKGNAAYAGQIRRRDALNLGQDIAGNNVPQRQFDAALGRMDDVTLPEGQRGYATAMADQVAKQRFSTNPYNSVYGSPLQQGKVGAMFPEGAPRFDRQYRLEDDMAKTAQEALGGSQTQSRNMADQLFQNEPANLAMDAGVQAMTGGGVPGITGMLGKAAKFAVDRRNIGLLGAEKKATEMAPSLLDTTNPKAVLQYLDDLVRKQAEAETRRRAYQKAFGTLSLPAAALSNGGGS